MILVDMNQVTLSNLMVQLGGSKNVEPDFVRHMVLNSLRSYRSKFQGEFGELCYVMITRLIGVEIISLIINIVVEKVEKNPS